MRISFLKSCLLAFATIAGVVAQTDGFDVITTPAKGSDITLTPGSIYTIKWTPSAPAGTVTIILLQGANNLTLELGATIAAGIDSTKGSYDWTVPAGSFALYGFKLQLDSAPTTFQYSAPFKISGSSSSSSAGGVTQTIQVSQVSTLPSSTVASTTSAPASSSSPSTAASSTASSNTTSPTSSKASTSPSSTLATVTSSGASSSTSASTTAKPTSGAVRGASVGTGVMAVLVLAFGMLL